jgi:hypothetical protein
MLEGKQLKPLVATRTSFATAAPQRAIKARRTRAKLNMFFGGCSSTGIAEGEKRVRRSTKSGRFKVSQTSAQRERVPTGRMNTNL